MINHLKSPVEQNQHTPRNLPSQAQPHPPMSTGTTTPTSISLMSAGTLSPRAMCTMSPGTNQRANISCITPSRMLQGGVRARGVGSGLRGWGQGQEWGRAKGGAGPKVHHSHNINTYLNLCSPESSKCQKTTHKSRMNGILIPLRESTATVH